MPIRKHIVKIVAFTKGLLIEWRMGLKSIIPWSVLGALSLITKGMTRSKQGESRADFENFSTCKAYSKPNAERN